MRSYQYTGSGVRLKFLNISWNADKLRALISHIPELDIACRQNIQVPGKKYDNADFISLCKDFLAGSNVLATYLADENDTDAIAASVICRGVAEIDNVTLSLIKDDNEGWFLMLREHTPWNYTEDEKNLTLNQLREIFVKWFGFIGVTEDAIFGEFGEVTAEIAG